MHEGLVEYMYIYPSIYLFFSLPHSFPFLMTIINEKNKVNWLKSKILRLVVTVNN